MREGEMEKQDKVIENLVDFAKWKSIRCQKEGDMNER